MLQIKLTVLATTAALCLSGCGGGTPVAPTPAPPAASQPGPAEPHPPPQNAAEDGEVIVGKVPKAPPCDNGACGRPSLEGKSLVREGRTLRFCSDRCRDEYLKNHSAR